MSCQCEVTKKYGEGIQLTEEEVKTFYEFTSKEDVYFRAVSAEVLNGLELPEERFMNYIKSNNEVLAKILTESNLFLVSLRKKYNCNEFKVEKDMLYPLLED